MSTLLNINWGSFFSQSSPLLFPLGGALLILLIGPFLKGGHRLYFLIAFFVTLFSILFSWKNWGVAENEVISFLLFDKFTYIFVILFLIATLLTLLLSFSYLKSFGLARPEYYALLLFSVFGMACMAAGSDLMVVFLGLEIMSVCLYVLAGFQRTNRFCIEASLKYFLIGAFASAFLLLGIAFIYGATGTTDLLALYQKGLQILNSDSKIYMLVGLSLLAVGFGFKIAIVPFHFWVADVYEGAPVVVTTFMATAVKAAGFAALLRVVWALFQWEPEIFVKAVGIASFITMAVGNIAALVQKNLKRMLAYSSIAHAGYALIPLVAFPVQSQAAVASISFYLLTYILMTVGAFSVLIALSGSEEKCTMQDLADLGTRKPFLAFAFTVFMISLAGIPPTMGFFGKYYLFLQAVQAGSIGLVIAAVINSVISVYYYLGPVVVMYFGKEEVTPSMRFFPPQAVVAVVWLTFLCVTFLGLFPSNLLEIIQHSVAGWLVAVK